MSTFTTNTSNKSRKTALILCIIGGIFGFHYFYVGRWGRGFFYMITIGCFMIGWFLDIIKILMGRFCDQYGNYLIEW